MKTHEEALKLALEGIKNSTEYRIGNPAYEQIEAKIEEALAQTEQQCATRVHPVTGTVGFGYDTVKPYTHEAQQSNEQVEPVAWVVESEEYNAEGERPILREIDYYSHVVDKLPAGTKLYTTPPRRKPLTDKQIKQLLKTMHGEPYPNDLYAFSRAIEAAHGIKEQP